MQTSVFNWSKWASLIPTNKCTNDVTFAFTKETKVGKETTYTHLFKGKYFGNNYWHSIIFPLLQMDCNWLW